jgi:acyl-coenzyme A synthetase/AMP-(fatty) acid ligase
MRAEPIETAPSGVASRTTAPAHGVGFAADLARHGERPALIDADGLCVSYDALAQQVEATVRTLGTSRKLVLLEATHTLSSVVTYLAALAGSHPVLAVPPGDHERTAALVARYDPDAVLLALDEEVRCVRSTGAHVLHPDLSLLLSTSGSTGSPKLVRLSRTNVESNAAAIAEYLELTDEDRAITSLPLHYCYGLSVLHSHLHVGAAVALTDTSVVDRCFWDRFQQVGVTGLSGVPHTFDLLERVGFDRMELPSLRYVTQAGGRLAPEKVRFQARLAERHGRRFFVMYGQTEATARMAYLPPEVAADRPEAIGVAIPGGALRIDAAPGEARGELVYTGPNVMLGYAQGPADLALGRTVEELRTGDLARRGHDGLYEIVGRASRFIKPFGLRVDLDEVEALLASRGLPSVCTGDDERLVVARELPDGAPLDDRQVREVVGTALGLPPGRVQVCAFDELPRLTNGKVDLLSIRAEASRRAAAGDAAGAWGGAAPDRDGVAGHQAPGVARQAFAEILGVAHVREQDTFASLGGDSLSYVEASLRLEQELGHVPRDWHITPVGQLDSLTRQHHPARRWRWVETNVVLRAAAIVLVVGTHCDLFYQKGGAHLLFGLAGANFARFQLDGDLASSTRRRLTSIGRIAVPTLALTVLGMATRDGFAASNLALVHNYVGGRGPVWFWYVEALLQVLVVLTVLLAVPSVRRAEQQLPFTFPLLLLVPLLGLRFAVLPTGTFEIPSIVAHVIAWLFVLGWLSHRAVSVPQRLLVSVAVMISVPGTLGSGSREVIVATGLLLAMWLPQVVVPAPLHRVAGCLASASLYVYLTHFFIYAQVRDTYGPWAAVAASLGLGILTWYVVEGARRRFLDPARAWAAGRRGRAATWRTTDATPSM